VTETNPVNGPEFSSHNLSAARNIRRLSALSESLNYETSLSSPSIGSGPSTLVNDPRTPGTCNLELSDLLSQRSNMFSKDSQPSETTESLENSLDSDMFSISDCSDDIEVLDSQETMYPMLNNILHQLLTGFRAATQYQSSPGEIGGSSGTLTSTTESAHTENTSRPSSKRKPQQDKADGTDEDDPLPPLPKKMKSGEGEESQKSFACPYLKWNPIKYSSCCIKKISKISYVKQHLHRKHTPERYCQTCQATDFPDDDSLERHIKVGICTHRDRTMFDGISYQQRYQMPRKSKPNASKEDQWYAIWEILFPREERPCSVYMDTDLALEMRHFREYCERHGPAIMRQHMESDPAWLSSGITEEQRRVLDRLIAGGLTTLFNNWSSNDSSISVTSDYRSNDNPQQSLFETPTSSLVDSGVVMGGQPAFRETGPQRTDFPPTVGMPAVEFNSQPELDSPRVQNPSLIQDGAATTPQTRVQTPPSASFGSAMGDQENPEDQDNDFEVGPLNDFDFDAFLAYDYMPVYRP
jgi:hypothetical protein